MCHGVSCSGVGTVRDGVGVPVSVSVCSFLSVLHRSLTQCCFAVKTVFPQDSADATVLDAATETRLPSPRTVRTEPMFLKTDVSCMRNLFCHPPTRRCLTKMADVRVEGEGGGRHTSHAPWWPAAASLSRPAPSSTTSDRRVPFPTGSGSRRVGHFC